MLMATVLGDESLPVNVRVQAGIQAKNFLSSHNEVEAQIKVNYTKKVEIRLFYSNNYYYKV